MKIADVMLLQLTAAAVLVSTLLFAHRNVQPIEHEMSFLSHLLPPTISGSLRLESSVFIAAPVEKVWDVLVDIQKYPEWCVHVVMIIVQCLTVDVRNPSMSVRYASAMHITDTLSDAISRSLTHRRNLSPHRSRSLYPASPSLLGCSSLRTLLLTPQ